MPYATDLLLIARLLHRRLRKVASAVGEAIGEQGGDLADYREFYWRQTAPIHRLSMRDPIAWALWAEAFAEGHAQGATRWRETIQGREGQSMSPEGRT